MVNPPVLSLHGVILIIATPKVFAVYIDMFQHKFSTVPWDHFLALGVGLTGPTEVQKVKKLIRHHIEGKLSLHLKFCRIRPTSFSFGQKPG